MKYREDIKVNNRKQNLDDLFSKKRLMNSKNSTLEIKLNELELPIEATYFDIYEPQALGVLKELLIPDQNMNFLKFGLYKIRESTRVGENTDYFIELFTNNGIIESLIDLLAVQDNQIQYEVLWCLINFTAIQNNVALKLCFTDQGFSFA